MSVERLKGNKAPGDESASPDPMANATDENAGMGPSPWDELTVHGKPLAPPVGKKGDTNP